MNKENINLPQGSTTTKMSSPVPSVTDAKMGVILHFFIYHQNFKINSTHEKYALNKRNASHVKIGCFELWKMRNLGEKHA